MNRKETKLEDLPLLPFEKILSYLGLEDRISSRSVSRYWRKTIDSLKVQSLFSSNRPGNFIWGKSRWNSSEFALNFIPWPLFFLNAKLLAEFILSNLKRLCLCDISLSRENITTFDTTLNLFDQLEELGLFSLIQETESSPQEEFQLSLPKLNRIELVGLQQIRRLTLDAPRLQNVRIWDCSHHLELDFIHGKSVERLLAQLLFQTKVQKLENLKYLFVENPDIGQPFLLGLKQLREIHLGSSNDARNFLQQKQKHDLVDLNIYFRGLLVNDPKDPLIESFRYNNEEVPSLAENSTRLADEIPFYTRLRYSIIERITAGLEVNLLNRFTNLRAISVDMPVQDVDHFLCLLKNLDHCLNLTFEMHTHPQDLFDRLPEQSVVRYLSISGRLFYDYNLDFRFLHRLKHLTCLRLFLYIELESIRKVLEELEFLSRLEFHYRGGRIVILIEYPKRFVIYIDRATKSYTDLNAAILFIEEEIERRKMAQKI